MNAMTEINAVGGLVASSVLVDLNISVWVGRKIDRGNTRKVVADNHARSSSAALVTKKLFVDNPKLEEINRVANKSRTYVSSVSLPWMGDMKLLPMSRFLDFQETMRALSDEFYTAVKDFLKDYDVQVSAMAFKLGTLFERSEYPTDKELATKFSFGWNISPLPTSGDFRVDAEQDLRDSLREQYERAMNDRINVSMNTMWGRLKECLEHMVDRLGKDEGGKNKIFRDSMLENAKELVNLLADFNISKDPNMERVRMQLHHLIDNVEPEELREHPAIREDVRRNVEDILSKFKF
jgi:hypothetical protein